MNQVWVTGDAVVDLIQETDATLLKCPGGAPCQCRGSYFSPFRKKRILIQWALVRFGTFMEVTLQKEGVNTECLVKDLNNAHQLWWLTLMTKASAALRL